ncbi:hypothetical protein MHC_03340 [Mycoplasma haemocanis str. Illinois]|uniref:Uncharacterized protein n=1 Tax=Mycoplasma haemocanis (strain Illinois) TaxID=1111676 RepID=H6N7A6_MYCHN|nr:hypothetical protein [Mycoplasma haemocanis]AEW45528.1 hypothetical protein MHC_03340 [Mycoplasma haemocanis str. Illinois]
MVKYFAVGVPVAAGVTGVSVYLSWPTEESVANRIKSSISGKDYLRLVESRDSEYWIKFKNLYKNFKGEKLEGVTENTLPTWCEDTLKSKVSSKLKKEIDFANKWCLVDTRSIKDFAKGAGKTLLSEVTTSQEGEWQTAWDHYKDNKEAKQLKITESKFTGAEGTDKSTGGKALKEWCTSQESKLMYEYGGEDSTHEKYMAWCTKQ